jgi:hypothetical protein
VGHSGRQWGCRRVCVIFRCTCISSAVPCWLASVFTAQLPTRSVWMNCVHSVHSEMPEQHQGASRIPRHTWQRSRWSAAGLGPWRVQNYETGLASGVTFALADRPWGSLVTSHFFTRAASVLFPLRFLCFTSHSLHHIFKAILASSVFCCCVTLLHPIARLPNTF